MSGVNEIGRVRTHEQRLNDAKESVTLLRDNLDALAWMCGDFNQDSMAGLNWGHWRSLFEGLHSQAIEVARRLD